jgi:hypothetical protein
MKRIKELAERAGGGPSKWYTDPDVLEKFAELIVRECLAIAKNREDELENATLLKESNAVGIVKYRIARQFGVKE